MPAAERRRAPRPRRAPFRPASLSPARSTQAAAYRALHSGATLERVIATLAEAAPRVAAPIILFTYYNPIMARGLDKFCADIRAAGASGLLVPDIPMEETDVIREAVNKAGLELVLLTTPTTGAPRRAGGPLLCLHPRHCVWGSRP